MKRICLVFISALLLLSSTASFAANVTLAWDPNPPEEKVTSYTVYWGNTSRTAQGFTEYENSKVCGNVTECSVDVPAWRGTTYFAVTATNAQGLSSDYSAEVSQDFTPYTSPSVPTNVRIVISITVQ